MSRQSSADLDWRPIFDHRLPLRSHLGRMAWKSRGLVATLMGASALAAVVLLSSSADSVIFMLTHSLVLRNA